MTNNSMNENEFIPYKSFEYRFDVVEFPESLKVAGVPKNYGGIADFIDEYFEKYQPLMKNADYIYEPYTVICVWGSLLGEKRANSWESGDRIFGCLVHSLDSLPQGIVGADTGLQKFLVMTVRGNSERDCAAVDHPTDNFRELMPKEYMDAMYPPIKEVHWHFHIDGDEPFYMSYIESDREMINAAGAPIWEKKYYAPLQ